MNEVLEIKEVKEKKQNFGIFYTPPEIAEFMMDILLIWKEKDEKDNKRWQSKNHYLSVIDPSVGEGIFLKTSLNKGFTKPDYIFGTDIDADVVNKWTSVCLLDSFDGNKEKLEAHFFHQNGLDKIHWEQHINKFKYKLKAEDIKNQHFDTVVGNPPFGGLGIDFKNSSNGTTALLKSLKQYEIFTYRKAYSKADKVQDNTQENLFGENRPALSSNFTDEQVAQFAEGIPIEVLFIERFIQLAKPNGWISIIVPDGILSNSNLDYVRWFIASKTKIEAIISLPRDTFKNTGTNAKTSILFLKKYEKELNLNNNDLNGADYPVFLTSISNYNPMAFKTITENYKKFYTTGKIG